MKQGISELAKENSLLINQLKHEKYKRQQAFEDSIHNKDKAEEEIKYLKNKVANLAESMTKLEKDIKDKIDIINVFSNEGNKGFSTP